MTIFPHSAWLAPPHFTLCGFSLPHKGGGVGMGWDFSPVPQGKAGMSLDFLDPTYFAPPHPCPARIDKG